MKKVAVVLAGSGYLDGAEIRESVITLLALDRAEAQVQCFAPDINQMHVVNHLTGEEVKGESRNVLVESARIARGNIKDLSQANVNDFDALILPGGFGAAKNLSDVAVKGADADVLPEFKELILSFLDAKKPIGAICISPAVVAAAVKGARKIEVTVGKDDGGLISGMGADHKSCDTTDICIDEAHLIVSCSAYMDDSARIKDVATGIEKLVEKVISMTG